MFGSIDCVISESGMTENMGIEVEIAVPSLTVQTLFPLPILLAAILNFGSLPSLTIATSTNVRQCPRCQVKVGMVENWETAFEIASQSPTVQKLFSVPVQWPQY